jgi:hypothetical protein
MGYSQGQERNALLSRAIGGGGGALNFGVAGGGGFGTGNLYGNQDYGQYF